MISKLLLILGWQKAWFNDKSWMAWGELWHVNGHCWMPRLFLVRTRCRFLTTTEILTFAQAKSYREDCQPSSASYMQYYSLIILDKNQALSSSSTSYADQCGHFEMKVSFFPFLMDMKRVTLAQKVASVLLHQCLWGILNMQQFSCTTKLQQLLQSRKNRPKLT